MVCNLSVGVSSLHSVVASHIPVVVVVVVVVVAGGALLLRLLQMLLLSLHPLFLECGNDV